jgi:hypothetical protein
MEQKKIDHSPDCSLIELYLLPQQEKDLRKAWGYADDLDLYAHIVYHSKTLELIYYQASSHDFIAELPKSTFISGWQKLEYATNMEKRIYKTTYSLPPTKAPRQLKLSEKTELILAPTHGYLLYQDQMTEILKQIRQVPPSLIPMYIRNWNLKKPATRLLVSTVYVYGINLDDLIEDRAYDSTNQFLFA